MSELWPILNNNYVNSSKLLNLWYYTSAKFVNDTKIKLKVGREEEKKFIHSTQIVGNKVEWKLINNTFKK